MFFSLFIFILYNIILTFFNIPLLLIMMIFGCIIYILTYNRYYTSYENLMFFVSIYTVMYSLLLIIIKSIVSVL